MADIVPPVVSLTAVFALLAVPDNVPVITFAEKLPLPSRNTNVLAVLLLVAAVKLFVAD